jgi:multidrug efflux pump subunit AcrA (membrane-fusion protein)
MKVLKISSIVLLTFSALASCTPSSRGGVRIGTAQMQDLEQRISVTGTIRGKRSSYVSAAYAGYVADLRVKLGDRVKEGDPLVRITQTVDQPLSQVFPIRAPFAGIVTQVLKNEGEHVTGTDRAVGINESAVLRLDDLSEIWLDAAVPEIDIAKIRKGLATVVRPNALGGATYEGVVRDISLSARESQDRWDRGKVEFAISVQVIDPDEELRAGMSAVADIIAARAEGVLTLAHEYVRRDSDRYYVVDAKGNEIAVEVGLSNESFVEITSGLDPGAQVRMMDFSQVKVGGASGGRRGRSSR